MPPHPFGIHSASVSLGLGRLLRAAHTWLSCSHPLRSGYCPPLASVIRMGTATGRSPTLASRVRYSLTDRQRHVSPNNLAHLMSDSLAPIRQKHLDFNCRFL